MRVNLLHLLICLVLSGCIRITTQPIDALPSTDSPAQPTMETLPNPASAFCEQQGYKVEIRTAADGSQSGVCIFSNGSECDEWAYFRGECSPANPGGSMPNPASVFCEQQGYRSEFRTAPDGSQAGVCIFPDGSECDEWAFFRSECSPPSTSEYDSFGWKIYSNDQLGYSFHYPADAQVTTNDDPLKSIFISGPGMGGETWGIAHPGDRVEYRPPEGVNLAQWLADHYLLGETRLPDVQIAGTTAIHFRHEGSPQSTSDDRYFFARNGQLFLVTIGHSGQAEDWELNNRFLESFQLMPPAQPATTLPTALPVDPSAYAEWMTYTNQPYNFSLRLPDTWAVEEAGADDPLMIGHAINLHSLVDPQTEVLRITFRRVGEDIPLHPTGVGEGEFISQGTLDIAGLPVERLLLVCPSGAVTQVWYQDGEGQPFIQRGDLEFGIILSTPGHCEPGFSLGGTTQQTVETILSSIRVP